MNDLNPRIAIPEPTSAEPDYNQGSWPQYAHAVEACGAVAVPIPLAASPATVAKLVASCSGVLLPGSPADVNPQKYGQEPARECAPADSAREAVDELVLQDAFNLHKPLLGICYGTQSLNVWKGGTLAQHLTTSINHKAGRETIEAHPISIPGTAEHLKAFAPGITVNSSHHQAIKIPGDSLDVAATAPDGTIEAVEQRGEHFVLGVQWHPERTPSTPASQAIFQSFVDAARAWKPREIRESVAR
ncbi:gamma-glutamyl-gamma-aminobutyrate hydrolase family protein [Alloacidobacterium dinghuense]|uniref:Gamma-glutamyl-gamma-aminobutyrate hydrolase family protein n=1 Tax=Alloacidobacterium dinghuense TaxID=2763107 RepID=A0A7G8BG61_9BACT|nr:gamma-glutamyl-gamma-aminobutyrate hydrolase family protein [Alloacidobacterium dinghuense]QNI31531.1 gamma-glutamyl-gamma-aminobutyrate hydrolase family protein [Alloacidobacterium dinghuense]